MKSVRPILSRRSIKRRQTQRELTEKIGMLREALAKIADRTLPMTEVHKIAIKAMET